MSSPSGDGGSCIVTLLSQEADDCRLRASKDCNVLRCATSEILHGLPSQVPVLQASGFFPMHKSQIESHLVVRKQASMQASMTVFDCEIAI